jgi:diguanylate cyclase (GGDEF)-like protein
MTGIQIIYIAPDKGRHREFRASLSRLGFKVVLATSLEELQSDDSTGNGYSVVVVSQTSCGSDLGECFGRLLHLWPHALFLVVGSTLKHYWDPNYPPSREISQYINNPWQPDNLARSLRRVLEERQMALSAMDGGAVADQGRHVRILLLEDNPVDADMMIEKLSHSYVGWHYEVTTLARLSDALEVLENSEFSLIITSLSLLDSQGLTTLSRLVSMTSAPVVVTGEEEDEHLALNAMRLGAQEYLFKSELTSRALQRIVRYSIERQLIHGRFQQLLQANPDGILVIDDKGDIQWANPAADELFGQPAGFLLGKPFGHPLLGDDTRVEIQIGPQRIVEMRKVSIEWQNRSAYIVSLRDITEYKRLQKQLLYDAQHDVLTGLANRSLLEERLEQATRKAKRNHENIAVMMLDLDRFKLVNDTLGHAGGDAMLKQVADNLLTTLRDSDTIARIGGDEFVVLAEKVDKESAGATWLAQKILNSMETAFEFDGIRHAISTSIGIALFPKDGTDWKMLLRHADSALYRAKINGRNLYHFYDERCHQESIRRIGLEKDLKEGFKQRQFCLHYQPQFDQNGLVGAEALMRWQHPLLGLLAPDEFIPLLERSNIMPEVEEWLLKSACEQLSIWQKTFSADFRMAVNMTAAALQRPTLPATIKQILESFELPGSSLVIELTESTLLKDMHLTGVTLSTLKAIGVDVTLDDFGTGYSALSYLTQLPELSALKLDRTMVQKLTNNNHNKRNIAILRSVINLAHDLNMEIIAEGVESMAQLKLLHQPGCDAYQSYLFAPPLSSHGWTHFFNQWNKAPKHFSQLSSRD